MVCGKTNIGFLRSVFILVLILSIIMTLFLQLRISSFSKHLRGIVRTTAKEISSPHKHVLPSQKEVQARLRATSSSYVTTLYTEITTNKQFYTKTPDFSSTKTFVEDDTHTKQRGESAEDGEDAFPISFPPQQKDALFRPWDQLEADQPFWQSVDDVMDVLMYSAHYDDVDRLPVIRVIGVARDPLPYSAATCRYYGCLQCPVMHSVNGSLGHFRNRNGRRYIGSWVLCPLPVNDEVLPFAVSVHKEQQTSGTRPIPIHYSNTTHSRLSTRVQDLLQQHYIVPKEGDLDAFRTLWKYVRNENFKKGVDNFDLKLHLRSKGDTAEINFHSKVGNKQSAITKHSEGGKERNKTENTGTQNSNQTENTNTQIFNHNLAKNGSDHDSHLNTRLRNRVSNKDTPKMMMMTPGDDTPNQTDPHRNLNQDKNQQPRGSEGYRWNVTRCFPAFQKGYNNYVMLAEMVAASRALGVDHFVFYVESVGIRVNLTLRVLQRRGLAEVLPWNLHMVERDLFYKGQFSAIQDCLYRHLRSSRYVLTGDVDELFVPKVFNTLPPLLDAWFAKKPNCGSFQFLNSFVNVNRPPQNLSLAKPLGHNATNANDINTNNSTKNRKNNTTNISSNNNHHHNNNNSDTSNVDASIYALAHQHALPMFLHTLRQVQILKPAQRSKIALDPRRVLVGSVHVVDKLRRGFRSCVMASQEGLLHHYRGLFGTAKVPVVQDESVRMYGASYVKEAVAILEEAEKMGKKERDW